MIKRILLGVAVLLIAVVIFVAGRPSAYRITRTATIPAPAAEVFAQVNDFHKWEAWSPWAKLDPAMKTTYEGSSSGAGAIYSWTGNDQVGAGRMKIAESRTNELVRIDLEFIKPFASTSVTEFTFKPAGNQTELTWVMSGNNNFMARAFTLFVNMDKMIGADFEKGLAQLRTATETQAKSQPSTPSH